MALSQNIAQKSAPKGSKTASFGGRFLLSLLIICADWYYRFHLPSP